MSELQRKQVDEWPWADDPEYNPNAHERWENGIPHDPRSEMIMGFVVKANRQYQHPSAPDISVGGDGDKGDNGEELLFQLDQYFFDLDLEEGGGGHNGDEFFVDPESEDPTRLVQTLETSRVETGSVKFQYADGERDWTGVFIRGDNAINYAMNLEWVLDEDLETFGIEEVVVKGLLRLLAGSDESGSFKLQQNTEEGYD